jgi:hypothetical protein
MCSFLSAFVSVPNTSLAACLLSDPLLDQNDFYDIHAAWLFRLRIICLDR